VVDRDLLLRRIALLETYLGQLGEYRGVSVEAYAANWKTQRIVERTLQLAIEACTDVCHHAIADRRLRVPSTYSETFEIAADAGLIPEALRASLVRMARFRNLLVHDYTKIDPVAIVEILASRLDDLAAFATVAAGWAAPEEPGPPPDRAN
jgi:uncharacterized protein YutE (UPF0331/DUF86 family)